MHRILVADISCGSLTLDPEQAHHLRDVLRMREGQTVELFDQSGRRAEGTIVRLAPGEVVVRAGNIVEAPPASLELTIASAVPKGPRADWMIEKLGELGATAFIPLTAQRSIVVPDGTAKITRWQRLARESARQSQRTGVMQILPVQTTDQVIGEERSSSTAWYMSTDPGATPAWCAIQQLAADPPPSLTVLIGPEGDWTPAEIQRFDNAGLTAVSLGATILRIETAAVCAAAIVASVLVPLLKSQRSAPGRKQ